MRLLPAHWLVISAALHVPLLWYWQPVELASRQVPGPLQVRIAPGGNSASATAQPAPTPPIAAAAPAPAPAAAAPRRDTAPSRTDTTRGATDPAPLRKAQARLSTTTHADRSAVTPTVAESVATPAAAGNAARAWVRSRIRDDLSRHFVYPMLARRHGWEGEVLVEFTVSPGGRIANVQVTRSSGHRILDRSAVRALARLKRVDLESTWWGEQSLDIRIPVVYRLHEHQLHGG